MWRPPPLAVLLLGLAACADEGQQAEAGGESIACALAGAKDFGARCQVERVSQEGALILVVHHPDGAFRRFEVLTDGRGLAVADGAHPGVMTISGDVLEMRVGADRYRFPYTAKAGAPAPAPAPAAGPAPVACAIGGEQAYARQCLIERSPEGLVLRHPDGGFRRFAVRDGQIVAADGAVAAEAENAGGDVALSVGADAYLIPAELLADAR